MTSKAVKKFIILAFFVREENRSRRADSPAVFLFWRGRNHGGDRRATMGPDACSAKASAE